MNPRCTGTGKDGRRCKLSAIDGSDFCRHHQPEANIDVDHITIGCELSLDMQLYIQQKAGNPDFSSDMFDERWPEYARERGHLDKLVLYANVLLILTVTQAVRLSLLDKLVLYANVLLRRLVVDNRRLPGPPTVVKRKLDGVPFPVTFHPVPEGLAFAFGTALVILRCDNWTRAMGKGMLEALTARNEQAGIALPPDAARMECIFLDIVSLEDSGEPVTTQFFPMATFIEAREIARTIGGHLNVDHWTPIPGERALQRDATARELNVIISAKDRVGLEQSEIPPERLLNHIKNMDTDAVFLYYAALALVMKHRRVIIPFDTLIDMIGWEPRDREDRLEMRRRVANWLGHFNAIRVAGQRNEKYRVLKTFPAFLDLTIAEGLYYADTSRMFLGFDASHEPVLVTLTATPWLQRLVAQKRYDVLQQFGNLRKLVDIPDGQPGGKWARGIGLALYQYWREQSSAAVIHRIGEANITRVRFPRPLTRQYLLTLFGCKPPVIDIIAGQHPERAKQNWDNAIRYLKRYHILHSFDYPEISAKRGPAFWNEWFTQPIIMNPHPDILLEIAKLRYGRRCTARFYELCDRIQEEYHLPKEK